MKPITALPSIKTKSPSEQAAERHEQDTVKVELPNPEQLSVDGSPAEDVQQPFAAATPQAAPQAVPQPAQTPQARPAAAPAPAAQPSVSSGTVNDYLSSLFGNRQESKENISASDVVGAEAAATVQQPASTAESIAAAEIAASGLPSLDAAYSAQRREVPAYPGVAPRMESIDLAGGSNANRISQGSTDRWIEDQLENNDMIKGRRAEKEFQRDLKTRERYGEKEPLGYSDFLEMHGNEENGSDRQVDDAEQIVADTAAATGQIDNRETRPSRPRQEEYRFLDHLPTRPFKEAENEEKEVAKKSIAQKGWNGKAFTAKVAGDRKLQMIDLSVGANILWEIIREPGNGLLAAINEAISDVAGHVFTVEDLVYGPNRAEMQRQIIRAINHPDVYIEVIGVKSPVVNENKIQRRRLKIHDGDGVKVHPTQTTVYNLDFDGDTLAVTGRDKGAVTFGVHKNVRSAMDYLIGFDKKLLLDTKMFPIARLVPSDDEGEFNDFFDEVFFLGYKAYGIDKVRHALYKLSTSVVSKNETGEDIDIDALWKDLIYAMQEVANKTSRPEIAMNSMLLELFDTMDYIEKASIEKQILQSQRDMVAYDQIGGPVSETDDYIITLIGDMSVGILPPTFQDFLVGMHEFIGEIPDANVQFRLGGKAANAAKISNRVVYSASEKDLFELYEKTLLAGMAAFMNGRAELGDHAIYIRQLAVEKVKFAVGNPADYISEDGEFNVYEFLKKFKEEFNRNMRLVEASDNGGLSCDLDRIPDPDIRSHHINGDGLGNFVKPLLDIYGDEFFGELFPFVKYLEELPDGFEYLVDSNDKKTSTNNLFFFRREQYKTLREFASSNNIFVNQTISQKNWRSAKPIDLLLAIAGNKTYLANKYNTNLFALLEDFAEAFKELHEFEKEREDDAGFDNVAYEVYVQEMIRALHMSGKGMFRYFGMGDPQSFIMNKWGLLMLEKTKDFSYLRRYRSDTDETWRQRVSKNKAEAANSIGGIRAAMVLEYRLRTIGSLKEQIDELLLSDDFYGSLFPRPRTSTEIPANVQINLLQNRILQEYEALESASPLWRVLVGEIRDDDNFAFMTLVAKKGGKDVLPLSDCEGTDKNGNKGCRFWSDSKMNEKYHSLFEVMSDPDLSKDVKEQVAIDVLRFHGYNGKKYEVWFQLEIEADSRYTSRTPMSYREQPSIISDISKAHNAAKAAFKKSYDNVRKDVEEAEIFCRDKPGALNGYLLRLADCPEEFYEIPDEFIVDTLHAQMRKTSKAKEKSTNERPVDGYYNALKEQEGGHTDSVYRTSDRVLGLIPERCLSAYDVVYVLAHPEKKFTVYNERGRWTLSRAALCGDNSEEALWSMLKSNPRIAALIRPQRATVGNKGRSVYSNAKSTLFDAISAPPNSSQLLRKQVKSLLVDKPTFMCLVSMLYPTGKRTPGSIKQERIKVLNALQQVLIAQAYQQRVNLRGEKEPGESALPNGFDIDELMQSGLGISVESLMEKGGMQEREARDFYLKTSAYVGGYVNSIMKMMSGMTDEEIIQTIISYQTGDVSFDFDRQSLVLGLDNKQTLNRAKTETSTGVEGSITQHNLGTGLWSSTVPGRFEIIDGDTPIEELLEYNGCLTNAGVFTIDELGASNILELEDKLKDDEPLIVMAPEGHIKQDPTLDTSGIQATTLGIFTGVKRDVSAEGGNLKVAKSGDDGKDSIRKTTRYDADAEQNVASIEETFESTLRQAQEDANSYETAVEIALFAARYKLAKILERANVAEGFEDFDLSDYMDLAMVMVKPVSDSAREVSDPNGGWTKLVIRGTDEISTAIRGNMPQDVVESGSVRDIIDTAASIADTVGENAIIEDFEREDALVAVSMINSNPFPADGKPTSMVDASESSAERNYVLFTKLIERKDSEGNPVSVTLPWNGESRNIEEFLGKDDKKKDGSISVYSQSKMDSKGEEVNKSLAMPFRGWKSKRDGGGNFYCPINVTRPSRWIEVPAKKDSKGKGKKDKEPEKKEKASASEKKESTGKKMYFRGLREDGSKIFSTEPGPVVFYNKKGSEKESAKEGDQKSSAAEKAVDESLGKQKRSFRSYKASGRKKGMRYTPISTGKKGEKTRINIKSITTNISPGPQSVWVIEPGASQKDVRKAVEACWTFGMTLAFTDPEALGDMLPIVEKDIMPAPFDDRYMMVPFFSIRLNGGNMSLPMSPSTGDSDADMWTTHVEDPYNWYRMGDSQAKFDSQYAKDVECSDSGVETYSFRDIFQSVLQSEEIDPTTGLRICDEVHDISIASYDDILQDIINNPSGEGVTYDLGIATGNNYSDDAIQKFDLQVREYESRFFDHADSLGILPSGQPDRIVTWAKCYVGNDPRPVYAPIIPFPTGETLSAPTHFTVESITQQGSSCIKFEWSLDYEPYGHIVKWFSEMNAAGKHVGILEDNVNLGNLMNGDKISVVTPTIWDASRNLGDATRAATIHTLWWEMMHHQEFNFAMLGGAFPDNPEIRNALLSGYPTRSQWLKWKDSGIGRYHTDQDLNDLVKDWVETAIETVTQNPTDLLANTFYDPEGNVSMRTCRYVDFNFFMDLDYRYQNAFMSFCHSFAPKVCPPSIDDYDESEGYLFKPVSTHNPNDPYSYGCLQMLVPYPSVLQPGKTVLIWSNVYKELAFFNDENSALHKVGMNGSVNTMERVAASAINGRLVDGKEFRTYTRYAASPSFKNYNDHEMHIVSRSDLPV